MTIGTLTRNLLAVIPIRAGGATLDAVIDTGFDGGVQLPDTLAASVRRVFLRHDRFQFPNGVVEVYEVYLVGVELGGEDVITEAIFSPTDEALIGVKFLADFRLTIDYPTGLVTLDRTRP